MACQIDRSDSLHWLWHSGYGFRLRNLVVRFQNNANFLKLFRVFGRFGRNQVKQNDLTVGHATDLDPLLVEFLIRFEVNSTLGRLDAEQLLHLLPFCHSNLDM